MQMIGRVRRMNLREVWPHEATNFTTWLQENIDILAAALDMPLISPDREQPAGSFSVDLIAEDGDGNSVVIENQLGKSDHDHLGKVITYLALTDAKSAVWIVGEPRAEHVSAIAKLNEGTADFYLVKLEAIRIEDSPPAALLTLITGPSREVKEEGQRKKEASALHQARLDFWKELLAYAKTKTRLHAGLSPSTSYAIGTKISGAISLNYYVRQEDTQIGAYIDRGTGEDYNRRVFRKLHSRKDQIEQAFGESLEWIDTEGVQACRIDKTISLGGWTNQDKWPEVHNAMVSNMIRFHKALKPHLAFAAIEYEEPTEE